MDFSLLSFPFLFIVCTDQEATDVQGKSRQVGAGWFLYVPLDPGATVSWFQWCLFYWREMRTHLFGWTINGRQCSGFSNHVRKHLHSVTSTCWGFISSAASELRMRGNLTLALSGSRFGLRPWSSVKSSSLPAQWWATRSTSSASLLKVTTCRLGYLHTLWHVFITSGPDIWSVGRNVSFEMQWGGNREEEQSYVIVTSVRFFIPSENSNQVNQSYGVNKTAQCKQPRWEVDHLD